MTTGRYPLRANAGRVLFTAALLAAVIILGLMTWPVPSAAYVVPAYVCVPTAGLLCVQLIRDLRGVELPRNTGSAPGILGAVGWVLLMPLLLVALGLVPGGAVYMASYLRWQGEEPLRAAAWSGILVGAFLAALAWLLNKPQLLSGILW